MNNDLFIRVGRALYGSRWQTELARELGYKDGRQIRQWISRQRPYPRNIKPVLAALSLHKSQDLFALLDDLAE